MPATPARLVVFDLDGTLVDSARDLADSVNTLVTELGGRPLPVDAIVGMIGDGAVTLVRRALEAAGIAPHPPEALERFLDIYDERLLVQTVVYNGVIDVLDQAAGVARLALLTNKPARGTARVLDGLDLARFFGEAVVSGDGPFARKPDTAGLRHLMARAGVTARETLMVGDSPVDLETARAAGTRVCLVRWGFGVRIDERTLRAGEVVVDDAVELVEAILGWSRAGAR